MRDSERLQTEIKKAVITYGLGAVLRALLDEAKMLSRLYELRNIWQTEWDKRQ